MAPTRRLWLAVLCGYLAFGATLQELPPFLSSRFHAGPALTGVVIGAAFAATAAGRPFAGRWGDAGRARAVVVTGASLAALAGAATMVAPDISTVFLCRLVMGAGEAALFSGALPWVLSSAPPEQRGRVAGWFGLSMWSGLTLGPVLASAIGQVADIDAVWWAVASLPLVSAILAASAGKPASTPTTRGSTALIPPRVGTAGSIIGLAAYGYGTLAAVLVLSLGHSTGRVVALPVFACAFLLVRGFGSPLVDQRDGAAIACVTLGIQAAGLFVLAAAPDLAMTLTGAAITGAGLGLIYPAAVAMTLKQARPETAGAAVGVMTSFWDLGILIAGALGGTIAAAAGFHAAFAAAGATALLALALAVRARRPAYECPETGSGRP